MQFLLIAHDGTDKDARKRRAEIRPEHLRRIKVLKDRGEFLFGGAILDESGNMVGSMILYEMHDKQTLNERLKDEPYVYGGVWSKIEIVPFRLAMIE
jgi:uncharacterized protein YciI